MKVIKNRQIVDDAWHLVQDDQPADAHAIVSLARWNAGHAQLKAAGHPLGVVLRSDEEAADIANLQALDLVLVDFPKFTDGRGYTSARLLKTRLGYNGEVRAIGDVMRDQMFLMRRCGIDSFAVKPGKDIEGALSAFDDFSVTYQPAADEEKPLFRRVRR